MTSIDPTPVQSVMLAAGLDVYELRNVRDNGPGFEPARAAELFEPFRRLHGARFEGSGVGLTIVRRTVERNGGAVWAEGHPGEGTAFYVVQPA